MKRIGLTVFFLVAFLGFDVRSGSQHAAQPRSQGPEYVADEVIVKFRQGVDEFNKDLARFRVSGTRKKLFRYVPGLEVVKLRRGVSVEEAVKLYQQDPNVSYAEPNYILKTTLTPNDPRFATGEMWGLNNFGQSGGTPDADIDAVEAWNQTTGNSNIIVAIIDSGVDYNHPDLSANMFRNEADCNSNDIDDDGNGYIDDCYGIDTHNNDSNPLDDNNHGTHVAGTIGAKGNNGAGVAGINWNIKMLACKFVNASGSGTTESAIDCLEYVKTMKDRGFNIIATSNSWGGGGFSQALFDAIDIQRQRGILFITAAGNGDFFGFPINNDQSAFYPCTYYLPNIICVASTTRTDARSSFSNYGRRTVHIGAPGSDILSTTRNGNYGFSSGTSMATPHVSGVAALLKAQDSNRDWRAIKNLILAAGDNTSSMSNITITQKRLNANSALVCNNSTVLSRLRPIDNNINGSVGEPLDLSVLHINCANPNGNVTVTVSPGNDVVTLLDNGQGSDQSAGDGIYSGQWTPSAEGIFTLTFPAGDQVIVNAANPLISVTPTSLNFTGVTVGGSADMKFTVSNNGGGVLTGNATINSPNFSIISGSSYSLDPGESHIVTVRFTPPSMGNFSGTVDFTGGGGASATVTGNGELTASIALNFDGKLRDAVGKGNAALGPDGSLDGVFTVTLVQGGGRTVTSLDLRRSNPTAGWDTQPNTAWVLGAADSLTSPLHNNPNNGTRVNFQVSQGGTFKIFASDNVGLFNDGATFTLTATFSDGSIATATAAVATPPPSPSIALNFDGKLRDAVGKGDAALGPDGSLDGVFTVTLVQGGDRTVTSLNLRRSNPTAGWDTQPNTAWVLGAADSLTSPLHNNPNNGTRVNFQVSQGGTFKIFASDNVGLFNDGATFTLTATFSDGSIATATAAVVTSIALNFEGKLRDAVGKGNAALGPDGSLDGVFTVTLVQGGDRTVTSLNLVRSNPKAGWDTEPNKAWVLGAADTLTSPLHNDASNGTRVTFQVLQGGNFKIFASDNVGLFNDGATFTLTAKFLDGTIATATTSAP